MATITINGVVFSNVKARSITVSNGRVIIDGLDATPNSKNISILVQGDLQHLNADACTSIEVKGNVGTCESLSGDIRCSDVTGSVSTASGDVVCGTVGGSVSTTSGDIVCDSVAGNASSMSGDVVKRR